jgi:hypothetical protein
MVSNWQIRLNNRTVKDGDDSLSGEPEQVKAFATPGNWASTPTSATCANACSSPASSLHESGSCFGKSPMKTSTSSATSWMKFGVKICKPNQFHNYEWI